MVISMSKIRNRIATRKKGIDTGIEYFEIGLKPHSNGTFFSIQIDFFGEMTLFRPRIRNEIATARKKNIV